MIRLVSPWALCQNDEPEHWIIGSQCACRQASRQCCSHSDSCHHGSTAMEAAPESLIHLRVLFAHLLALRTGAVALARMSLTRYSRASLVPGGVSGSVSASSNTSTTSPAASAFSSANTIACTNHQRPHHTQRRNNALVRVAVRVEPTATTTKGPPNKKDAPVNSRNDWKRPCFSVIPAPASLYKTWGSELMLGGTCTCFQGRV